MIPGHRCAPSRCCCWESEYCNGFSDGHFFFDTKNETTLVSLLQLSPDTITSRYRRQLQQAIFLVQAALLSENTIEIAKLLSY